MADIHRYGPVAPFSRTCACYGVLHYIVLHVVTNVAQKISSVSILIGRPAWAQPTKTIVKRVQQVVGQSNVYWASCIGVKHSAHPAERRRYYVTKHRAKTRRLVIGFKVDFHRQRSKTTNEWRERDWLFAAALETYNYEIRPRWLGYYCRLLCKDDDRLGKCSPKLT